eukprot:469863-Rhodomonas_salina.2
MYAQNTAINGYNTAKNGSNAIVNGSNTDNYVAWQFLSEKGLHSVSFDLLRCEINALNPHFPYSLYCSRVPAVLFWPWTTRGAAKTLCAQKKAKCAAQAFVLAK